MVVGPLSARHAARPSAASRLALLPARPTRALRCRVAALLAKAVVGPARPVGVGPRRERPFAPASRGTPKVRPATRPAKVEATPNATMEVRAARQAKARAHLLPQVPLGRRRVPHVLAAATSAERKTSQRSRRCRRSGVMGRAPRVIPVKRAPAILQRRVIETSRADVPLALRLGSRERASATARRQAMGVIADTGPRNERVTVTRNGVRAAPTASPGA